MSSTREASAALIEEGTRTSWGRWLVCPQCRGELRFSAETVQCPSCEISWPVRDGVPQFVTEFTYWGEIPSDDMEKVNAIARRDSWRSALVGSQIPSVKRAAGMILNLDRANWANLVDCPAEGRVLDVGAGMGTISHSLALSCGEVVAVEPVQERIEFMQQRFMQEKLTNITVVRSSIWQLPFRDESFDLLIMNGVLEWVPEGLPGDPQAVQEQALRNALRLLKPGGSVYIGIENRIGLGYFIGYPDPHYRRPLVTILPRKLGRLYTKLRGWPPYRNYLYSRRGYRRLLESCGFEEFRCFLALPSYNHPRFLMPVRSNAFDYFARHFTLPGKGIRRWLRSILIELDLLKEVEYSFAMFARKPVCRQSPPPETGGPRKPDQKGCDISEPRGFIAALRSSLLERSDDWKLPSAGDWNFIVHNDYTPHYSTMNVFWFNGASRMPSVVTKIFNEPRVPEREFHNLETAYSLAPWVAPRPLCLEARGRQWALWMQGLAGLPFIPGKHHDAAALSGFVQTLTAMHRAFAADGRTPGPNRYQRMVLEPLNSVAAYGDSERVRKSCLDLCASITREWIEALPPIPQHGDLAVNNVLVDGGDWRILDWENFGAVDLPFYDLAVFLVSILHSDGDTRSKDRSRFARFAPFVDSYSRAFDLQSSDLALLLPLALANWFHLHLAQGRRQFASRLYRTIADCFEHADHWDAMLSGSN